MRGMPAVPTMPASVTLNAAVLKKAIDRYYRELDVYKERAQHELALRSAFQNLLANTARYVNWTLIPEQTIEGGIRPDGVMRDVNNLRRGYWEAKGPNSDLDREIAEKIKKNYPLTNTIFENTRRAVLYQGKRKVFDLDITRTSNVQDVLQQFLTYTEPHIEKFQAAVLEFKARIPELAFDLLDMIGKEHRENIRFVQAFANLRALCRASLDPSLDDKTIDEMLVQHLLIERIFRTVFYNFDFVNRNIIAAEIEKVIAALTSRSFNRQVFLKHLDRYYVAIEGTARGIESWIERQEFLNVVYEGFFQGFSIKQADTHGIVYTPPEIVNFMCSSVEEVLKREFGTSIADPGVKILDPCVGTGSFIINLVRNHIPRSKLKYKYKHDLFCNEIMLLPYYIASLNIEHEYYERMNEYIPFEGICFADTLNLEGLQMELFSEKNMERIQSENNAQIMVVLGNPPYNVGQKSENDNNKNRKYPVIDERIRKTYAKDSKASNKNALSDAYVKFFRWATDRLQGRDGIVCFVSNNGFLNGIAFDGFRKHFLDDFNLIYHFDFKGDARTSGEARKAEGGNIFDDKIRTGIGITMLVRASHLQQRTVYYHCVGDYWSAAQKRKYLSSFRELTTVPWQPLIVDANHNWLEHSLPIEFSMFPPLGTKEAKSERVIETQTIFRNYGSGVKTNRDEWAYDFNKNRLADKIKRLTDTYNGEVDRWRRRDNGVVNIDNFVSYDNSKIKWSRDLKLDLQRGHYAAFSDAKLRKAVYRPFCKQWLFFDRILNEEVYQTPHFLPAPSTDMDNTLIVISDHGHRAIFSVLAVNVIPDLHLMSSDAFQCFPYYIYAEDGSNRRENITDWALAEFQAKYGSDVTKWDIFHYVYAMLHHQEYRVCYAENLKRELPRIPLLHCIEAFQICARIGKQLMELHLHYEHVKEYPLQWVENPNVPFSYRVEKMRLTSDHSTLVINQSLSLACIPPQCFLYRLGNLSALEWVIDQYQVSEDKRSGIVSDPNSLDDEEYIVRLVGRVVTVSVETVQLVNELASKVTMDDWSTSDTATDKFE